MVRCTPELPKATSTKTYAGVGCPSTICAHNAVCSACSAFALASVYMQLATRHRRDDVCAVAGDR